MIAKIRGLPRDACPMIREANAVAKHAAELT